MIRGAAGSFVGRILLNSIKYNTFCSGFACLLVLNTLPL